jgi:hypothetical protein
MAIPLCEWPSQDAIEEGRVQGLLKYEVWKGTNLSDEADLLDMAYIWWTGAMKSKVPIRDEYISTLIFSVVSWEFSITGIKGPTDALGPAYAKENWSIITIFPSWGKQRVGKMDDMIVVIA